MLEHSSGSRSARMGWPGAGPLQLRFSSRVSKRRRSDGEDQLPERIRHKPLPRRPSSPALTNPTMGIAEPPEVCLAEAYLQELPACHLHRQDQGLGKGKKLSPSDGAVRLGAPAGGGAKSGGSASSGLGPEDWERAGRLRHFR